MNNFKKTSIIITLFAVMLSGCCKNTDTPAVNEETAVYEEVLRNKDNIEIPEGMTFGDICNLVYIDGKQIEMPCDLKGFLKQAEGFILTDENGTEVKPDDSFLLAYFRKGDNEIRALHGPDGDIAYIITDKCESMSLGGTIGIGDDITEFWKMLGCEDKYTLSTKAKSYMHWFTDVENAVYIKITADEKGIIQSISFDADEKAESIPEKEEQNTEITTEAKEENIILPSFEITEWTMEELVSDIEIDGIELSLPCSADIFIDKYETEELDYEGMNGRIWCDYINKDGKDIAMFYYDTEKEEKNIEIIIIGSFLNETGMIPEFNIMGITEKSTPEDIVNILGKPNYDNGYDTDYIYYFSEDKELDISLDAETKTRIDSLRIRYIN